MHALGLMMFPPFDQNAEEEEFGELLGATEDPHGALDLARELFLGDGSIRASCRTNTETSAGQAACPMTLTIDCLPLKFDQGARPPLRRGTRAPPRTGTTGFRPIWPQVLARGVIDCPRPRRPPGHRVPLRSSYSRPGLLLPHPDGFVVVLDGPPRGLLPRPAVPREQPPDPLDRVGHMEQSADQSL